MDTDVFISEYQTAPLDFHTDHFYISRKSMIDARLEEIATSTAEDLSSSVGVAWEAHNGKMLAGVRWDGWTQQDLQDIARCMGPAVLCAVCGRLARDRRHSGGGLPDLTLWNAVAKKCKLVEVKGPNDRMSETQLIWADVLLRAGADYEICRVASKNARQIPRREQCDE